MASDEEPIPGEEGEPPSEDLYTKRKKKKERNESVHFDKVRKSEYICVEIPGRVKKGSSGLSAVESLGGIKKITELFHLQNNAHRHEENLILRVNNNDMFSSFVSANSAKVNNVLIKIKRTRKNVYKFEFLGFVRYLYYFDNMIDFYYIPTFYNRRDYSTNYIHYLTRGKKKKKKKKKSSSGAVAAVAAAAAEVEVEGRPRDPFDHLGTPLADGRGEHFFPSAFARSGELLAGGAIGQFGPHQNVDQQNMPHVNYFSNCQTHSWNNMADTQMGNHTRQTSNVMNLNAQLYDSDKMASYERGYSQNMSSSNHVGHNKDAHLFLPKCGSNANEANFFVLGSNGGRGAEGGEHGDGRYRIGIEGKEEDNQVGSFTDMRIGEMGQNVGIPMCSSRMDDAIGASPPRVNIQAQLPSGGPPPFNDARCNHMMQMGTQEDDYFSDEDYNELYKKIISCKNNLELFDQVKESEFSSDESEGYELNCCIHSKSTSPYFYRNYEATTTSRYLREYRYLISKFTSPIFSNVEASKGEMEKFIQELIINRPEQGTPGGSTLPGVVGMGQSAHGVIEEQVQSRDKLGKPVGEYCDAAAVWGVRGADDGEQRAGEDAAVQCDDRSDEHAANHSDEHPANHSDGHAANLWDDRSDGEALLMGSPPRSGPTQDDHETSESRTASRNVSHAEQQSNQIIVSKKPVHCNPIAKFDDPTFPCNPFDSALKKYVSDKLYKRVKDLFEVRPIWSKEVILEHLDSVSTYCLKSCFSRICFYFADGPWRRTYCKYGYDPRKDPSSYIYQTIDFRDNYFREIKMKSANEMNRIILKRKNFIDRVVTKIIKRVNITGTRNTNKRGKPEGTSQKGSNTMSVKMESHTDQEQRDENEKRDFNIYSEWSQSFSQHYDDHGEVPNGDKSAYHPSTSNQYPKDINDLKNMFDIYSSAVSSNDEITPQMDEEINDIFQFLKKSITFHLRKSFSAESHFSVSPLKLSTVYQYVDIYDNNVADYLSNLRTQDVCTKDYGWMNSNDIAKIRDILFVRSVTLRRAHIK
ncbi:general transcription factor 3C polypeptide 5, putative [Plasmodium vivax]|uniref:General transcription factor 3C polypeptide 5, putative n=1 Tax=Plasmodium vivax TaxID=5855 RepID=A0A1G4H2Z4_PLAVI|nr:general transcription factor 3C polypeptide 5, putative [Plasmodium vivax]